MYEANWRDKTQGGVLSLARKRVCRFGLRFKQAKFERNREKEKRDLLVLLRARKSSSIMFDNIWTFHQNELKLACECAPVIVYIRARSYEFPISQVPL